MLNIKRKSLKKIREERNKKICEVFTHLLNDGYSTHKALQEIGLIYELSSVGVKKILIKNNVYRTTGHIKKRKGGA